MGIVTTNSGHEGETRFAVAADGRRLAFCEWGDPAGAVIFYLHGMPGSRLLRHPGSAYADAGLRVITYDRPGYGLSDPNPGRDVADAAADVVAIADALGLVRFPVAGVSLGGLHALAVAARLPDRGSSCAAIKAPAPPAAEGLDYFEGMTEDDSAVLRGVAHRGAEAAEADAAEVATWVGSGMPELDALGAVGDMLRAAFGEGFRRGPVGHVEDLLAYVRDPGFATGDVAVPTLLLAARDDEAVPPGHAHWWAAHLPHAELTWLDGDHFTYHEAEEIGALVWAACEASEERRG